MDRIEKLSFGLTAEYYLRQMFFSALISSLMIYSMVVSNNNDKVFNILVFVALTFLYPYSRFVYERIRNFILGENVFFLPIQLAFFFKIITMFACWFGALFIAPIGLIWLHYKKQRDLSKTE